MKKQLLLFVLCSILSTAAFAQGTSGAGGGDACKQEINRHRETIRQWILRDEAKGLDFTKARIKGQTYASYKQNMLRVLEEGAVQISCFLDPSRVSDPAAQKIAREQGVSYKAIFIGNPPQPVTCVNYEDPHGQPHIDCNYDLVMNGYSKGDPNYRTTHHEFASIARVEKRTGGNVSDFSVSSQLSQFERWTRVKVLGQRKPLSQTCILDGRFRKSDVERRMIQSLMKEGIQGITGIRITRMRTDWTGVFNLAAPDTSQFILEFDVYVGGQVVKFTDCAAWYGKLDNTLTVGRCDEDGFSKLGRRGHHTLADGYVWYMNFADMNRCGE